MKKDILVPDIGDFDNVEIIEVLVKEGQKIQKNDSIVTLESDKSSVEVPSTEEGEVLKILVKLLKVMEWVNLGKVLIPPINKKNWT